MLACDVVQDRLVGHCRRICVYGLQVGVRDVDELPLARRCFVRINMRDLHGDAQLRLVKAMRGHVKVNSRSIEISPSSIQSFNDAIE